MLLSFIFVNDFIFIYNLSSLLLLFLNLILYFLRLFVDVRYYIYDYQEDL